MVIDYQNRSDESCSLSGYPVLTAVLSNASRALATDAPSGYLGGLGPGDPIPVVNLSPGGQASSTVESVDNPASGGICPRFVSLDVAPPGAGASQPIVLAISPSDTGLPDCTGQPEANPVVAGTSGSSSDF